MGQSRYARKLAIVSGGMDSVTLAHLLHRAGELAGIVSFDYHQRHVKELPFAEACAERLGVPHRVVYLGKMFDGADSALVGGGPVPDGHYAEASMKATVVPNRNAIMLSVATAHAIMQGCDAVAAGMHGGDHFIYPDCRPDFVQMFSRAMGLANEGFSHGRGGVDGRFYIDAPFLFYTKAQIVDLGSRLRVPYELTWSCYKGGDIHCGACGTCYERREAFTVAGVPDPTTYEATPEYAIPEGV